MYTILPALSALYLLEIHHNLDFGFDNLFMLQYSNTQRHSLYIRDWGFKNILGITYWQISWYYHVAKDKARTMVSPPARLAHEYPQGWFYKISEFTNIFLLMFSFLLSLSIYYWNIQILLLRLDRLYVNLEFLNVFHFLNWIYFKLHDSSMKVASFS